MASCKWLRNRSQQGTGGFTLAEGVIALGVLSLFVASCFTSIVVSRVTASKAKEQAIAMGFLSHYTELVRGLPFTDVIPGHAINPLLNGANDSPNIRIPTNADWVNLNSEDFEAFHPDLIWLQSRNPRFRVGLSTLNQGGTPHSRHLNIRVEWDAPLGRGGRLHQELDLVRVKDL